MKQKYKIALFILVIIGFIVGFYMLWNTAIHNLGSHAFTDEEIEINGKFLLNKTSAYSYNLTSTEEPIFVLTPTIEEFNYDKKFIIARTTDESNVSKDKKSDYWIIDVKTNHIYGPMNKKDFFKEKVELSLELELKKVSKFF
ncbi:hypothetical protein AMS59_20965 [Lysinibacillus sp. FJAT-14745]|uniref:DUF3997 domain-containing protein n=1 Tax=Lysinibacillus sp. FJAT-14745 TaxID=1704289 RepID=UPI0006AB93AC|nr:DUF3997 domain-containing protein [Lysinibacillus sp. FJAT-14745]KOP70292.1 hypothetical protein AMS59_20965 [Lysinibacillus sp. FJAT-14745]